MTEQGFTEHDWQLFRKMIPGWQEAYMDRLNKEYVAILSGDASPSDKFHRLSSRISKDRNKAGVSIDMRRAKLVENLVSLIEEGVINHDDLEGFSDELKLRVRGFFYV